MQITTIGLDLAKHWFQVHGVDANGQTVVRNLSGAAEHRLLPVARAVSGRHGSVRDSALLGA